MSKSLLHLRTVFKCTVEYNKIFVSRQNKKNLHNEPKNQPNKKPTNQTKTQTKQTRKTKQNKKRIYSTEKRRKGDMSLLFSSLILDLKYSRLLFEEIRLH